MSSQSRIQRLQLILPVVLLLCLQCCAALRCRTDDGPSEAELKRITRSCMRKIGENNSGSGAPSASSASTSSSSSSASSLFGSGTCNNNNNKNNNHSPQQQQPQMRFGHNYDNDSDEDNNNSNNNNNNNHNYNTNYNFGGYGRGEPDMVRRRNRDRQQTTNPSGLTAQMAEKAHNAAPNNERTRYEYRSNGGGGGGGAGNGGSNSAGGRSGNGNGGNGNNGGNGGGGHGSNRNGANSNNSGNNNAGKNNNNNNNNNNNSTYDSACVVHCFFEEMNMLNPDDYPDRYKVQYLLTRELRDRELRHFYTDTIQQCFHYLESQRRRDKCHYSRELINCMSEYAKANCDDWQEYNVIFN